MTSEDFDKQKRLHAASSTCTLLKPISAQQYEALMAEYSVSPYQLLVIIDQLSTRLSELDGTNCGTRQSFVSGQ